MIFQEPMTSLNPLYSIGDQIMEAMILHQDLNRKEARRKALEILDHVGISDPALRMKQYPYQLSGGMRQRVMIAIALSCRPELLIADEPTTALDVTIQAQILDLLEKLRDEIRMSMILITHNLALVRNITHRLAIMYAGKIVESAATRELFTHPLHPYTRGLFECIPRLAGKRNILPTINGTLPNLIEPFRGCAFLPRCSSHRNQCQAAEPCLREMTPGHQVSCHLFGGPSPNERHAAPSRKPEDLLPPEEQVSLAFKGLCESRRWSRPRYPRRGKRSGWSGKQGAGRRPWGRASSVFSGPSSVESSSREWIFCSNQRKNCDSSEGTSRWSFRTPMVR